MNEVRPLVRVMQGMLKGVTQKSINGKRFTAFKGIPYAEPPIDKLRFQDPVPVEPWSHVKDASKFGACCAQLDMVSRTIIGSDDCLYLNVYTPLNQTSQSSLKPVMFWIHGGYFAHGSGDDMLFGPDYIVEKDVVLVTINYRLHVLGFLNVEDEEASGNQGLKDQLLALKWVRDNIANFDGDPKNVTIFGESAGAASAHYLALSPLAEGLYHKAICQSSVAINPWVTIAESPKVYAQNFARILGKDINDSKTLVEYLRSFDAHKLAQAEADMTSNVVQRRSPGLRYFVPSDDAKSKNPFLPTTVEIASRAGVKVPLLIGNTSHEGIIFLTGMSEKKYKMVDANFETALSPGVIKWLRSRGLETSHLRAMYFGDKPVTKEDEKNYMQMHSDLQFRYGVHEIVKRQVLNEHSQTYLYTFSYDNGMSLIKSSFGLSMPGACHADELSYTFYPRVKEMLGIPLPEPGTTEWLVIERMTEMWTNFAKTGNPTPAVTETLPVIWEPVKDLENFECLNIGEDLKMERVLNINKRCVKEPPSKL